MLSITCDNAENNRTFIEHLCKALPDLNARETLIRCFAHILNLAMRAILKELGAGTSKDTLKCLETDAEMQELTAYQYKTVIQKASITNQVCI